MLKDHLGSASVLTDASGNIPIDCYGTNYCGTSNSTKLPDPPRPKKDNNDNSIPDKLTEQLLDAGVSEDFVNSIELIIYDEAPFWDTGCWGNFAAHTNGGSTVIFCSGDYFDQDRVNPILVHELVHVRQSRDDKLYRIKNTLHNLVQGYDNNPYEKEAYTCAATVSVTYKAGQDLTALNTAPCSLP